MSDISKLKVGNTVLGLKDAAARETLEDIEPKVDAISDKCDEILEVVAGGVSEALDELNGEVVPGGLLAKVTSAQNGLDALKDVCEDQGMDPEEFPAKFADIKDVMWLVYKHHACGWDSVLATDKEFFIADYAFYGQELVTVNCPNVWEVGVRAFANCLELETVNLPSVNWIDETAFEGCPSLKTLHFSERMDTFYFHFEGLENLVSVTGLGGVEYCGEADAFKNCTELLTLDFSPTCYEISDRMCCGCTSLEDVGELTTLGFIPDKAFYNCIQLFSTFGLTECFYVGNYAFYNCEYVAFEDDTLDAPLLEGIGESAFEGCHGILVANLYSCYEIGADAFWDTEIEELHFSRNATAIRYTEGYATRWGAGANVRVYFDL